MEKSSLSEQEIVGAQLTEEISQLQGFSLGEGTVLCQVCGSSFSDGDPVVVYLFRRAGESGFQSGDVMCGDGVHRLPVEFALGVRELLVGGQIGVCSKGGESWMALRAPELVGVSAASTTSIRMCGGETSELGGADSEVGR